MLIYSDGNDQLTSNRKKMIDSKEANHTRSLPPAQKDFQDAAKREEPARVTAPLILYSFSYS
jgi:hypothetical protein